MLAIWSLVPLPFLNPWDFPGKNTEVVCHFLLQGIFLTQGLNPGLPHCRQTLYHLSHQRSLCFLRGEHIWKGSAAILLKNKVTLHVVFMLPNITTFMIIFFPHRHVICCYSLIILCTLYSRVQDRTFNWFLSNSKLWYGEGNGTPLQYSCLENPMDGGAWWAAVHGVAKSRTRLSDFTFAFHFNALEKEMATHSSVLAWRIPGTGDPGGLPSLGSHRVRHNWSDLAASYDND